MSMQPFPLHQDWVKLPTGPRGLFVVFEGVDGSGKGTLMPMLYAALEAVFGKDRLHVHKEPSDVTPLGRKVRDILFHDPELRTHNLVPNVQDLLFLADHVQSTEKYLKPNLQEGRIVLADRFIYSQIAFSSQRTVHPTVNFLFEELIGVEPHLIFFLYGKPETLYARANSRPGLEGAKQKGKIWNTVESLSAIQKKYFHLFNGKENVVMVNVDHDTPEQTFTKSIYPAMQNLLRREHPHWLL